MNKVLTETTVVRYLNKLEGVQRSTLATILKKSIFGEPVLNRYLLAINGNVS